MTTSIVSKIEKALENLFESDWEPKIEDSQPLGASGDRVEHIPCKLTEIVPVDKKRGDYVLSRKTETLRKLCFFETPGGNLIVALYYGKQILNVDRNYKFSGTIRGHFDMSKLEGSQKGKNVFTIVENISPKEI